MKITVEILGGEGMTPSQLSGRMSCVADSIRNYPSSSNVTHKVVVPDVYGGTIGTWEVNPNRKS
jgi:hypothetical protein